MAKLYINKEIMSEDRKYEHWWLTGADGQSFDDIRSFLQWMDHDDTKIEVEIHSCGGVPIQATQSANSAAGEDMLARAFAKGLQSMPNPVVSVQEISDVSNRVRVIENLSTI